MQKRNRPDRDGKDKSKVTKYKRYMALEQKPCSICGLPINYDLESPHPWSFTVDHIIPINKGGTSDFANLAAAHRKCNSVKGQGQVTIAMVNRLRLEQGCKDLIQECPPRKPDTVIKEDESTVERIQEEELLQDIEEQGEHPESDYCKYLGGGVGLRPEHMEQMWTEEDGKRWTVDGIKPTPIDKLI